VPMKGSSLAGLLLLVISACSSGSDDNSSTNSTTQLISVNGSTIPDSADIAIMWIRGPGDDQSWEFYLTDGGYIESGRAYITGTSTIPPQIVAEDYGVAVGAVLVYPKGQTPEFKAYSDTDVLPMTNPIGVANRNAYIYKTHDINPIFTEAGFEFWGDTFPLGFSCAQNIEIVDEFDEFAFTDCSEVEFSEIEIVGLFDWT